MAKTLLAQRREFIIELVAIKNRAMQLGLIRTFHAIDGATTTVGWEVAEHEEREAKKRLTKPR